MVVTQLMMIHGQELKTMTFSMVAGPSFYLGVPCFVPLRGPNGTNPLGAPFGDAPLHRANLRLSLLRSAQKTKARSRCSRHKSIDCVVFASLRSAQKQLPRCARTRAWFVMLGVAPLAQKRTRAMHKSILCEASMRGVHA